jgi:hypothetical protein
MSRCAVVGLVLAGGLALFVLYRRRRRSRPSAPDDYPVVSPPSPAVPRNINASSYRRGGARGRLHSALSRPIELTRIRRHRAVSPPPPYIPGVVLPQYGAHQDAPSHAVVFGSSAPAATDAESPSLVPVPATQHVATAMPAISNANEAHAQIEGDF